MGGDRGGWNPLKGPPVPRWLASWRKDFNSCEVGPKTLTPDPVTSERQTLNPNTKH